jgi:hypothetical protein
MTIISKALQFSIDLATAYRQFIGSLGLPRISYTVDSITSLPIPFIQVPNAFLKF